MWSSECLETPMHLDKMLHVVLQLDSTQQQTKKKKAKFKMLQPC